MSPNLVVVSVKVEDSDELLAEGEAADAVAALVEHGRVDADPHRVGQHHHHAPRHRRLAGETHLQYRKMRVPVMSLSGCQVRRTDASRLVKKGETSSVRGCSHVTTALRARGVD